MENDLVSIVIPVFNSEKYVDKAIRSCLDQTYSKIEIIAIYHNSTDSSLEILNSFSDHITVLSEPKRGIGSALNTGIRAMKGTFFKVMNSDDILYPDSVELLISEFKKQINNKVIIHGNADIINAKGEFVREWIQPNYNKLSNFKQNVILLANDTVINVSSIFRKDIFYKYGFYDETVIAEDYELWLRLCLLYNFQLHLLEKKILKYRLHDESTTAKSLKINPNYAEIPRKMVLQKLDLESRIKYERALKESLRKFEKQNYLPFKKKTKLEIDRAVSSISPHAAKKLSNFYRTLTRKTKKE